MGNRPRNNQFDAGAERIYKYKYNFQNVRAASNPFFNYSFSLEIEGDTTGMQQT